MINDNDPPPGPSSVVVLSHALQSRFGGREGHHSAADGQRHLRAIAGVMPKAFDFPAGTKVWVPLVITSSLLEQRQSQARTPSRG